MVGLITRSQVTALDEPAPSWMFALTVLGCPGVETLDPIFVTKATIPQRQVGSQPVNRGARIYHLPSGPMQVGLMNLDFIETDRYPISAYLNRWLNKVMDQYGRMGLPKDYMAKAYMMAFDTTGMPGAVFTIAGLWPQNIGDLAYDVARSGHITRSASFYCHGVTMVSESTIAGGILNTLGIGNGGILGSVLHGALGRISHKIIG